MLFNYEAVDQTGAKKQGSIDAINVDVAISSLQRRGLVLSSIKAADAGGFLSKNISFFDHVATKDIVILSRQLSTLFEAQVSALRVFRLLGAETENHTLAVKLQTIADDLQSGSSMSVALSKHPKVFSE
ncbi:MAG: type II secretion system F family protein, partial [Patescibacteria group bacterium]|nr:type II secretion system F family protein [Patescibacteria group bacterium]